MRFDSRWPELRVGTAAVVAAVAAVAASGVIALDSFGQRPRPTALGSAHSFELCERANTNSSHDQQSHTHTVFAGLLRKSLCLLVFQTLLRHFTSMADARTLLRQQRAAREQAKKAQKPSAAPAAAPASRKRKAVDDGSEEKKRTRTEEAAGVPAGFFDAGAQPEEPQIDEAVGAPPEPTPAEPQQPAPPTLDPTAEAELDDFLSEMNKEAATQPQRNYTSGAVIEAAPMTAAELAAQAREEQSAQRARRDEDMEAEKEEAARALEDEFEEMEGLDERVKRLREQREALRSQSAQRPAPVETLPVPPEAADGESESDDDDEDWDDWRFRPA